MTGGRSTRPNWLQIAMRRDIYTRSFKVAVVVGSILTMINNGDLLLQGIVTSSMGWKIPLTFFVPFCVSTYAGVQAVRNG
jgi:hypothetical protein